MPDRPARVYWFDKGDDPSILIFDAGYEYGDIHIYEHKKKMKATELPEQKRIYGHHRMWDLVYPGGGGEVTRAELEEVMHELTKLESMLLRILANKNEIL